jgi:FSR family fosmidomycin resistance protein-like MFS transporter
MIQTAATPQTAPAGIKKDAVWSLSLAHLLNDLVTTGLVPALLPVYKLAFHLSYLQSGLIVLASYFASSITQPLFGLLTDKRPLPWLLPLGVLLSNAGLAVSGAAPNFAWVLACVFISGLGSGAFHPEASRCTHLAAGKARGFAQAIFQVGGNAGQALGPAMIPLFILDTGVRGLLWLLVTAALAFAVTLRLLPWYANRSREERKRRHQVQGRNHIAGVVLLVLIVILRSWCQIGVAGFLPFFYTHHHVPLARAELLTFLFLAAGAVSTFIGGAWSDRIGRKWLLVLSLVASIPFAWLLPYASGLGAAFDLIAFGFTILASFAATVVFCQQLLPRNIGLASGLMVGFGVGAGGIGAALFGWIGDHFGIPLVFQWIGVLPVIASVLALLLPGDKPAPWRESRA